MTRGNFFQKVYKLVNQIPKKKVATYSQIAVLISTPRAARMGVNPRNPSEKIQIGATKVPKFKAGKGLKEAVRS